MAKKACDDKVLRKELAAGMEAAMPKLQAAGGDATEISKIVEEVSSKAVDTAQRVIPPDVYRIAVVALGIAMLTAAVGYILIAILLGDTADMPDGLVAIGSGAVGALAGLMAPTGGEG